MGIAHWKFVESIKRHSTAYSSDNSFVDYAKSNSMLRIEGFDCVESFARETVYDSSAKYRYRDGQNDFQFDQKSFASCVRKQKMIGNWFRN